MRVIPLVGLAGLLIAAALPALAQTSPLNASPLNASPMTAVPLGPNPSECEIQAALLGVAGPGCPPLRMQRPAAPPPAVAPPLAAAKPGAFPAQAVAPVAAAPELKAAFRVEFDFNATAIRPESRVILDRVAAVMTAPAAGSARFRVVGHTDAVGGDAANLALSERRALAVVAYLTGHHHIAANRLEASGRGLRELLLPDQPTAAANRRVEIVNLGE
ncbi:OmpA family protein [Azospirillum sp.]|uniref:OmpA family protein n=1 Tax=Azospirillum sp. TaxID=34012 RepID=UPI0026256C67|nr:OmpA family protein [Azospirillum sp.]